MSKGIVLISGVNGYIASVHAAILLEAGYTVRGTVRKASSAKPLQEVLAKYGDKLQIVEVPDITVPGAFDEAVKGVTAIAHLASPVSLSFTDPDPILHAALEGTKTILASAKQHAGPQLKSFVLMSSIAAILNDEPAPYVYSEKDWNTKSVDVVKASGKNSNGGDIYRASKVVGERALWDFGKAESPSFALSAINPAFVLGPPIIPGQVPETLFGLVPILSGKPIPPGPVPMSFVDVRDIAHLTHWVIENPSKANGERYLAIGGIASNQAIADVLREAYPDRKIDVGKPGSDYPADFKGPAGGIQHDSSKASNATGRQWNSFANIIKDTAKVYEASTKA